jgi:hypothetical protein
MKPSTLAPMLTVIVAGHLPMSMQSNLGIAHVMSSLILDLTILPRGVGGNFKITGANNS